MANKIWDGQVELFNWYNNCDERTLDYRSSDIRYDFMFLHYMLKNIKYPDNSLAQRYKELHLNNVALTYAKSLQGNISSQLRKADIDQQAMAGALQEMHQIQEVAQMLGDNGTAQKVKDMANAQIDMIGSASPELAAAFRRFYSDLDRPEPEPVEDEGEIADNE